MLIRIKSKDNQVLKLVRSLAKRKYREANGKFVLEGRIAVEEALNFSVNPQFLVVADSFTGKNEWAVLLNKAVERNLAVYQISDKLFTGITQTEEPQGVLIVVGKQESTWDEMATKPNPFWVVIDGLQDPGNLGTIIRTAAAVNVDGLILTTETVDIYNPKTLRSTMGAVFRTRFIQKALPQEVVAHCHELELPIVVADPKGAIPYYQWDFTQGMALVIGSESQGPGRIFMDNADTKVVIPMPGKIDSLNAGVAASLLMLERVRQQGNTATFLV